MKTISIAFAALAVLLTSSTHASAVNVFFDIAIPACTPETYDSAIQSYSEFLAPTEKQRLNRAIGELDSWFNTKGRAAGFSFTRQQTLEFLADVVCGRKGISVERSSRWNARQVAASAARPRLLSPAARRARIR